MASDPYLVMTVCTGNICRSPMAEVILRDRFEKAGLGDRVVVDSTGVSSEEAGNPIDPRARTSLVHHGYDVDGDHRARRVRASDLAGRDLVLAMTAQHAGVLRRLAGPDDSGRVRMFMAFDPASPVEGLGGPMSGGLSEDAIDVADPWYGGQSDFEDCLVEIEAAADGVVEFVRAALDESPAT